MLSWEGWCRGYGFQRKGVTILTHFNILTSGIPKATTSMVKTAISGCPGARTLGWVAVCDWVGGRWCPWVRVLVRALVSGLVIACLGGRSCARVGTWVPRRIVLPLLLLIQHTQRTPFILVPGYIADVSGRELSAIHHHPKPPIHTHLLLWAVITWAGPS